MSQAKVMSLALQRRMQTLKSFADRLPINERVQVYLKVVRRNENERNTLAAAACDCARTEIMRLFCIPLSVVHLSTVLLSPAERLECYAKKIDQKKVAFDRLLVNLGISDDWRKK